MTDTAIPSVWDAIERAINEAGPGPVSGFGKPILKEPRTYRGRVTPGLKPAPGYFLLGQPGEDETDIYDADAGQSGDYIIHCWADTPDNAVRLYRWLKNLLADVRLPLDGHEMWQGFGFRFMGLQADTKETAWQSIAAITVESREKVA